MPRLLSPALRLNHLFPFDGLVSAPSCSLKYEVFNQTSVMDPTESAASQSKKRKRGLDVDDLKKLFHAEPDDYKIAWNELKHRIIEISEHAPPTISSVSFYHSCITDKNVLWAGINELPVPLYRSDNVDRILAVTSETHQNNEAFSRIIIDQILISALYEENTKQISQQRDLSQSEDLQS